MSEPKTPTRNVTQQAKRQTNRTAQAMTNEPNSPTIMVNRLHAVPNLVHANFNVNDRYGKPLPDPRVCFPGFTGPQPLLPTFSQFGPPLQSAAAMPFEAAIDLPTEYYFHPYSFQPGPGTSRTVKPSLPYFGRGYPSNSYEHLESIRVSPIIPQRITRPDEPTSEMYLHAIHEELAALQKMQNDFMSRYSYFQPLEPVLDTPFPWSESDTNIEYGLFNMTGKEYQQWKRTLQDGFGRRNPMQGCAAATVALAAVTSLGAGGAAVTGVEVEEADLKNEIAQKCDAGCRCGFYGCPGRKLR